MKIENFRKAYSLRETQLLSALKYHMAKDVILPVQACLHHITQATISGGISGKHPLLLGYPGDKRVYHVNTLPEMMGSFRRASVSTARREAEYFRNQSDIRRARDLDRSLESARSLVICDYTFLLMDTTYTQTALTLYSEWYNIRYAMLTKIKEISPVRTNFLLVEPPVNLPSIADFRIIDDGMSASHAATWLSHESLDMLMLFQYISGKGMLAELSEAEQENLIIALYYKGSVAFIPLAALADKRGSSNSNESMFYREVEGFIALTNKSVVEAMDKELAEREEIVSPDADIGAVREKLDELASGGSMSSAEQKRYLLMAKEVANIEDPIDPNKKITDNLWKKGDVAEAVDREVPNSITNIVDESFLPSTVFNWKKQYVKEQLHKDVVSMCLSVKNEGIIVKSVKTRRVLDAQDDHTEYTIQFQPVGKAVTTLTFPVPKIDENGTFVFSGVRMTMDTQRADKPIRKSKFYETALTSYYGKTFIRRSEKAADSYPRWLLKQIISIGLDSNDSRIESIRFNKAGVVTDKLPVAYTGITRRIGGFKSGGYTFTFASSELAEIFDKEDIKKYNRDGSILVGKGKGSVLVMGFNNQVTEYTGGKGVLLGSIEDVLKLTGRVPKDHAVISVYSRSVPVAIFMSYLFGFEKLLRYLKVPYRVVPSGTKVELASSDIDIKFKDDTVIIDARDPKLSLIFAGFRPVRDTLRTLRLDQLNSRINYQVFNSTLRINTYAWREMELMRSMFIDPITEEYLDEMGEPTTYDPLIVRAVELITDDRFPAETDRNYQRFRGYERIPGFLYKNLVDAIREMNNSGKTKSVGLAINPKALMLDIISDQSVQLHEELNPVHELKQMAAVNLGGKGGRSAKTLVARSRAYHETDLGTISEASPDSSKVAIRTFFTPNANITNLRGTTSSYKEGDSPSTVVSTTALLMPGSNHDDASRVNLLNVQMSAMVAAVGYKSMSVRTGMEQVIGSQASNDYAYTCPINGVVTLVTKDTLQIKSESGEVISVSLAVKHGKAAGVVFPHAIVTDMVVGDKVAVGDIVAWNSGFFQRDWMNPRNVEMKLGAPATVVFMENSKTYEDSSAISPRLCSALTTRNTKTKTIIVGFDKDILNLAKVGDNVDLETVLCTIQDTALNTGGVQEDALSALSRFAKNTPVAKFIGAITKIDVVYIGSPDDMSPTLKTIVSEADKSRAKRNKQLGLDASPTGRILADNTMLGGSKLIKNQVALTIYMDGDLPADTGDKGVLGSQLKTIFGQVIDPRTRLATSGEYVDVIFSYRSVGDRIVLSSEIMGIGNRVSVERTRQAVKLYKSLKGSKNGK